MAIIHLYKDTPGPVSCRGPHPDGGLCGAETFVTVPQTIDTSKRGAVMMLGCFACGDRMTKPAPRPGLGRTYGEIKYPVRDHIAELAAYEKEREKEWEDWGGQEAPDPSTVDLDSMDWGEEEQKEPDPNVNIDELDWGDD